MRKKNNLLSNQRKRKQKGFQKERNRVIPTFDTSGSVTTAEKKKREKNIATALIIVAFIIGIIYLPGFFMEEKIKEPTIVHLDTELKKNQKEDAFNSVKTSNDYLKNHPSDDFDKDGISNSEELSKGTNPWRIDTDRDYMTDACEIRYTQTNPLKADNRQIVSLKQKLDIAKGKKMESPYKLGKLDVTLWADNYSYKAVGGVAQTVRGYNFCGFKGVAAFPEDGYFYSYQNGIHTPLTAVNRAKHQYYVNNDNVEIFKEPLQEVVSFKIFGKEFIGPSNFATRFFSFILPEKGLFASQKKMKIDTQPDGDDTMISVEATAWPNDPSIRFGNNNISISDLQFVREQIKNNICVAVSLYRINCGEYVGIIYGFDSRGNFYIADNDTLQPVGKLNITNTSYQMLDEKGNFVVYNYYEFTSDFYFTNENNQLTPFSSYNNDNINFFAASAGKENELSPSNSLLKKSIEETKQKETDHQDAITTTEEPTETTEQTTETVPESTEDTGDGMVEEEATETVEETPTENPLDGMTEAE